MLDLLIKNAKICDGTGDPSFMGYVGVSDGQIVEVEQGSAPGLQASRTIDADGLVLSPGFIDPHTHYDAQVLWDPLLTCSPWHGVTTVVQGNCGLGVAPLAPEIREIALRDLEKIEDIPYEVMASVIHGQWESLGEYMDFVQQRGIGINVLQLVPMNPMRQTVMGEACWERAANDDELKAMENLYRQCLKAGGFGWSADLSEDHVGCGGRPVASRLADRREFEMLCRVLSEAKSGAIMVNRPRPVGDLTDENYDFLTMAARLSGKSVTYTGIINMPDNPHNYLQAVNKLGDWLESGRIVPQTFVKPVVLNYNFRNPFAPHGAFKVFKQAFDKSVEEQKALYRSPEFRTTLRQQIDGCEAANKGYLERTRVLDGKSEEVRKLVESGKSIAQIAKERGVGLADCWLDIALNDDLNTEFNVEVVAFELEGMKNLIGDPRILPGLADGGAHIQTQNDSGYATYLLGHWCREHEVIPIEEAVRKLTSFPADVFGIGGRGRIKKGNYADLTLFDFDTVHMCPPEFANDLPGGQRRMITHSKGVEATIVNGEILFEKGKHSGAMPGTMLRNGGLN